MKKIHLLLLTGSLFILLLLPISFSLESPEIEFKVRDIHLEPISGAIVLLKNDKTNFGEIYITNETGEFTSRLSKFTDNVSLENPFSLYTCVDQINLSSPDLCRFFSLHILINKEDFFSKKTYGNIIPIERRIIGTSDFDCEKQPFAFIFRGQTKIDYKYCYSNITDASGILKFEKENIINESTDECGFNVSISTCGWHIGTYFMNTYVEDKWSNNWSLNESFILYGESIKNPPRQDILSYLFSHGIINNNVLVEPNKTKETTTIIMDENKTIRLNGTNNTILIQYVNNTTNININNTIVFDINNTTINTTNKYSVFGDFYLSLFSAELNFVKLEVGIFLTVVFLARRKIKNIFLLIVGKIKKKK